MTGISLATVHDEDLRGLKEVAERCGWDEVGLCVRRHQDMRDNGDRSRDPLA